MPINQIVTPLDAAVLDSKEQYSFYFKIVDHVLKELLASLRKHYICTNQETVFLKQYCELLIYSIEAMRVKYMYDEEENMKIDLTESGFPNYLEFRYLYNDLLLRNEHIAKLPQVNELKTKFLDVLLKEKRHVAQEELHQAASIIYYTSVNQDQIFRRFIQGKILKMDDTTDGEYLVSWCFYDLTFNRPFVCFMYFDFFGKKLEDHVDDIYDALRNSGDRHMDLDGMAFAIDKKLPKIAPRKIRRIDLGPVHNVFAKDENLITHSILEAIGKKDIDLTSYAVSFKIDEVQSKGTLKDREFLTKEYMQIWGIKRPENYLFTTHRVMQLLYTKVPELMDKLSASPFEMAEVPTNSI